MSVLDGSRILMGITGGIAAYKTPLILRLLVQEGASVRVVTTAAARHFVAAKTLEVLSRSPVYGDLFESSEEFPVLHVGLAEWADLVLIAPSTANLIGKMANGIADDLLSTILLCAKSPVVLAPAMEEHMLDNVRVQENVRRLREQGVGWVEPDSGELASGAVGRGRMATSEVIVDHVRAALARTTSVKTGDLRGLRLLVTAGPTLEDIDPVRFIGNRSSGKMGFSIAERARDRGADVHLVSGPTSLEDPPGIEVTRVRSALQMQGAVEKQFEHADAAILAAAVADYRVREPSDSKISGKMESLSLELVANPDIAAGIGARKGDRVLVGFAMETKQGTERAKRKLEEKCLDLIALNNLGDEGAGFAVDTNVVTLIDAGGGEVALPKMTKSQVADELLDRLAVLWRRDRS